MLRSRRDFFRASNSSLRRNVSVVEKKTSDGRVGRRVTSSVARLHVQLRGLCCEGMSYRGRTDASGASRHPLVEKKGGWESVPYAAFHVLLVFLTRFMHSTSSPISIRANMYYSTGRNLHGDRRRQYKGRGCSGYALLFHC